jgi:hypothetical protein
MLTMVPRQITVRSIFEVLRQVRNSRSLANNDTRNDLAYSRCFMRIRWQRNLIRIP